jgi:hypothetical protein
MNKWNQQAKQQTNKAKIKNNNQANPNTKIKNWVLQTCGKGGHHVSIIQMAPQSLDSKERNLNQPWNIH